MAAFTAHNIQRVLIAYDRDEASDRAAEKLAKELADAGLHFAAIACNWETVMAR